MKKYGIYGITTSGISMVVVMYLYTAHIPTQFMVVITIILLLVGGEIRLRLVKAPLAAAISP